MPDPLRVAFIGAGSNTTLRHLPGLLAIDGVTAIAVCNRSKESGQRVADEFDITRVEDNPASIFEADDIDAICIGTWPYRHRDYTVRALESGKHVLCEARMAMNAAEAREMLAASRKRENLVAQLVPAPMDLLVWRTIQRLIKEQTLGEIREVHVDVTNGSTIDKTLPLHWRNQTEFSGHNVMAFGIWNEIINRWLGKTESVIAVGETFVKTRHDAASGRDFLIEIPDSLGVLAKMSNGARVNYRISTVTHAAPPLTVAVYGSEGTLRWLGDDNLTFASLGEIPKAVTPDEGTAVGWNVEKDFVDSIRENKPVELTNLEAGLHYMCVTDAVHQSLAEGRVVNLEEV